MPRILPERTVEAWTTAYITRWHPTALLWAPTQRDPRAWDLSAKLPRAFHFVFEYKGVEGWPEPYVPINVAQLLEYARLNERLRHTLVWYLLPAWDVPVQPGQMLPVEAARRFLNAADPRPEWRTGHRRPVPALVSAIPSAREETAFARGCESFFYVVEPAAILGDRRMRTFPGWRGPRGFPVGLVRELARGLTLEHFISLVERGQLGVPSFALDADDTIARIAGDEPKRPRLPPHRATAVAIKPLEAEY
jgi:hypothetical protein